MASPEASRCPACGAAPGTLRITRTLVANPTGTYSVAGAQTKVTARERPVLTCTACPLNVTGEYEPHPSGDPDRAHAVFTPPPGTTS